MYESPLHAITKRTVKEISQRFDDMVLQEVINVGVHVDREELIKSLEYDRDQYNNGYEDGLVDGKPKWISVEDRLPEKGDSYLVVVKEKYPHEAKWNVHVDVASNYGHYIDDYWDTFNDWDEGQEVHITHWMPLPEPPKEE